MAKKQQTDAQLGLQALKRDLKQHTLQKGYIFYCLLYTSRCV